MVCVYLLKRFPRLTQTFVLEELLELERQGVPLAVVARRGPGGDSLPRADRLAAPVHYVPEGLGEGAVHAWIAQRVTDIGARHVHAHFAGWAAEAAARVGRATGVPYSFTAHATDIYRADVDAAALAARIAGAAFVVTVTDANRARLEALLAEHGLGGRVVRLYNGVDLRRLTPGDQPREPGLVAGAGRLVEKKGHGILVEALHRLHRESRSVRAEIAGEGPLRSDLERQIAEAGPGAVVTLLGGMPHDAVLDLLRRAAVLALPSVIAADGDQDALPTVILEAMALGTPVVSTTVNGIPEMVEDGVSGFLVPPGDAAALAGGIATLLDDEGLRQRMAKAARSRVEERFDIVRNVTVLRSLLTGAAR